MVFIFLYGLLRILAMSGYSNAWCLTVMSNELCISLHGNNYRHNPRTRAENTNIYNVRTQISQYEEAKNPITIFEMQFDLWGLATEFLARKKEQWTIGDRCWLKRSFLNSINKGAQTTTERIFNDSQREWGTKTVLLSLWYF